MFNLYIIYNKCHLTKGDVQSIVFWIVFCIYVRFYCKYLYIMNIEASKRIRIKIMANISTTQNPMPILYVDTIEAVIDEICAHIFIFIFL